VAEDREHEEREDDVAPEERDDDVAPNVQNEHDEHEPTAISDDEDDDADEGVEDDATINNQDETPGVGTGKTTGVDTKMTVETIDEQEEIEQDEQEEIEQEMDAQYGDRKHRHGLRPRRPRDYKHVHTQLESTVMTQHSIKKGLKIFGEDGAVAVISEMTQLHDMAAIDPKQANMLTRDEKRKALNYLMFLKKKRCGRIKGRGCADGRKQRIYKTKEELSSPTVAIESLMLSSIIDAKERRTVATADIPGAFMQADMDEVLHMRLEGSLAKLLTRVNPELYTKYLVNEKGKPVLYV
jgi:hypothetical protein